MRWLGLGTVGIVAFASACGAIAGLDDPDPIAASDAGADAPEETAPPSDASTIDDNFVNITPDAADTGPSNCDENGLLAHWRFEEGAGTVAHDCTSGKHDGTITGATWTAGKIGVHALAFADNQVDVGNPTAFKLTGAFSVTAWINATSTSTGGRVISKSSQADRGWELNTETGDTVEFKVAIDSTTYVQCAAPITTGVWHHLAGTYAPGATTMRLYIDGTEVDSLTSAPSSQRDAPFNVLIGAMPNQTGNKFQGTIDEVRLYGRALNAAEVKTLATP